MHQQWLCMSVCIHIYIYYMHTASICGFIHVNFALCRIHNAKLHAYTAHVYTYIVMPTKTPRCWKSSHSLGRNYHLSKTFILFIYILGMSQIQQKLSLLSGSNMLLWKLYRLVWVWISVFQCICCAALSKSQLSWPATSSEGIGGWNSQFRTLLWGWDAS